MPRNDRAKIKIKPIKCIIWMFFVLVGILSIMNGVLYFHSSLLPSHICDFPRNGTDFESNAITNFKQNLVVVIAVGSTAEVKLSELNIGYFSAEKFDCILFSLSEKVVFTDALKSRCEIIALAARWSVLLKTVYHITKGRDYRSFTILVSDVQLPNTYNGEKFIQPVLNSQIDVLSPAIRDSAWYYMRPESGGAGIQCTKFIEIFAASYSPPAMHCLQKMIGDNLHGWGLDLLFSRYCKRFNASINFDYSAEHTPATGGIPLFLNSNLNRQDKEADMARSVREIVTQYGDFQDKSDEDMLNELTDVTNQAKC